MAPDSDPPPRVPWLPVSEGQEPPAPAEPESLAPTKPIVPAWIQRNEAPAPADEDDEDVPVEATDSVEPPAAEEMLPSPVDSPLEEVSAPDAPAAPWSGDAVQMLGDSAVASATLSAAGAPTPLGGVPTVPADEAITPPSFGDEGPRFTPTFAPQEPPHEPPSMAKADALAAGIVAEEQAILASKSADLDGGVAYSPVSFDDAAAEPTKRHPDEPAELASTVDTQVMPVMPVAPDTQVLPVAVPATAAATAGATAGGIPPIVTGDPGEPMAQPAPASGKKKRRWWLMILIALLIAAAIAAAFAVLNRPDPKVVPGATITQPAPSPTLAAIAAPSGTAFQSALPTTVGTFALVEATVLDPADIALTAGRVADGVDLVYRDGSNTMNVRALQYYSEDEAKQMFTQFAGEGAATQPVEAGGTTVGESAIITSPKPGMVWRNGTSVFILTGPALLVSDFYAQFGL